MKSRLRQAKPIIALAMMIALSGSMQGETLDAPSSNQPAPNATGKTRRVLESFPTSQGVFELSMSPETKNGYGFDITWRAEGEKPSMVTMPRFAVTQDEERADVESMGWGADPGSKIWSSGIEGDYIATVARPVVLDDDTTGLLVTQLGGFEDLKRNHCLWVPINGRLKAMWTFDERQIAGPTWSSTLVLPKGKDSLGQIALFYCHLGEILDDHVVNIAVTRFVWNQEKTNLVSIKPGQGSGRVATALLVGNFITIAEAFSQRETLIKCLQFGWVLSNNSVKEIPRGHTALVKLFVRREEAELDKKRLAKCGIKLPIKIVGIF